MLAALVLFSAPTFTQAAEIEVGSNGALRIAEPKQTPWTPTGVTGSEEALKFGDAWKEAFQNPGTVAPVKTHAKHKMTGAFTETILTIADMAVVYDKDAGTVTTVLSAAIVKTDEQFNPFLIFAIIAVLAMIVSNTLPLTAKDDAAAVVVAVVAAAAAAAVVVVAAAAVVVVAAAAVVVVAAVVGVVVAAVVGDTTVYKVASGIFYVAMLIAVYAMYVA